MVKKIIIAFMMLVVCQIFFWRCASMDDFLEISIDRDEPTVIFNCDITRSDSGTLMLLAVEDAYVYKGVDNIPLEFYLKNTNGNLPVTDNTGSGSSSFIHFSEIRGEGLLRFLKVFPQLEGMIVFGIFLKNMAVDQGKLETYKTMGNAEWRNITTRNGKLIRERDVVFITSRLDAEQSVLYGGININTFQPAD